MHKKALIKRFNVGSSKHDFLEKPFGFCCDIKEQDPKMRYKLEDSRIEFPPNDLPIGGGGPNIKFRVQEGGQLLQRVQRNLKAGVSKSGVSKAKPAKVIKSATYENGTMICKRCKGPLQWYLEDEIAVARDIIANRMQAEYNAELEENVKIAMEKGITLN